MLRSEHSIVHYEQGQAIPDRLTRRQHAHYLRYVNQMLAVYRSGAGRPRRELHQSIQNVLAREPDCEPRRIAAFCKLLDDASEFDTDRKGESAELRLRVFSAAAKYHPLVSQREHVFEREEVEVKQLLAQESGEPWEQIESRLYADVISQQPLKQFDGYAEPQSLLSRYNVAQLQACLYRAKRLTVVAEADFKTILRYAKLAHLLHEIRRIDSTHYLLDLSGPASVVHQTRRYGVNFARFIPALLSCKEWKLQAMLESHWGRPVRLSLTSTDGYTSHLPPPAEFDSSLEEDFARRFGQEQDGWRLERESAILHGGQTTFVPDFTLRHQDGREVFLEIVGFWTPEYLERKRQTLHLFRGRRILIAVARRSLRQGAQIPSGVIVYKTTLNVSDVLQAVNALGIGQTAAPS